jgi:hypothetical protein
MATFIGFTLIIVGLILAYALALRPWLKNQPWAARFFAWIEPFERNLFKKSETVLVGRLVWLGGAIVAVYDGFIAYFSTLDVEPLTTRMMDYLHIPPDLRGFTLSVLVTGLGFAIVRLRKTTTKPLEVVAAPQQLPPAAAVAVQRAEAANQQAVQAVQEAAPT